MNMLKSYAIAVGLAGIAPHDLRRSYTLAPSGDVGISARLVSDRREF
jgi:hypothetical protein